MSPKVSEDDRLARNAAGTELLSGEIILGRTACSANS
jgi:hypothetical protein